MQISIEAKQNAQALLDFIDLSPSPWHAVATTATALQNQDFVELQESTTWQLKAGGKYFVVRDGGSIIAFVLGQQALADSGLLARILIPPACA